MSNNPNVGKVFNTNAGFPKTALDMALGQKQDRLVGAAGQVVGFDAEGKPVAQAAPESGVSSFNGRKGAISPKAGDYTAADVGASPTGHKHTKSEITDFPSSMPASDVAAWAKAPAKPAYTAAEVGASPTGHKHTKSEITDFPTSLPASDVSTWAKAASKPSYTASEVGAKASTWKPFSVGSSTPSDTTQLWIDTTANTGGLKYYNGTTWVNVPVAWG